MPKYQFDVSGKLPAGWMLDVPTLTIIGGELEAVLNRWKLTRNPDCQWPVLVIPGWPHGFCPVHAFERRPCGPWCVGARAELRVIQDDLDSYWRGLRWAA